MNGRELDCERVLERLFELIDHELAAPEREAMERHLHACKSCFSRADFERRLKARLAELHEGASPGIEERIDVLVKGF